MTVWLTFAAGGGARDGMLIDCLEVSASMDEALLS